MKRGNIKFPGRRGVATNEWAEMMGRCGHRAALTARIKQSEFIVTSQLVTPVIVWAAISDRLTKRPL